MNPQAPKRKLRSASRLSLLISFVFHALIIAGLVYFAAREGLLGKQMKKIAVQMVKEPPPEKPKEPEKPREQPPKVEPPKVAVAPQPAAPVAAPKPVAVQAAVTAAPPAVAPPAAEIPDFAFEGGKTVQTSSDPVQLYRGLVESTFRSRWQRPLDLNDENFIAEVEVSVNRQGQISDTDWKRGSGNTRWDDSVRQAIAATRSIARVPPTNFPSRILIRFDVQDETEPLTAGGL
jgi:outer membrane biosynthesis protein TonB